MRTIGLVLLVWLAARCAVALPAEGCAPTPEAAARGALGAVYAGGPGEGDRVPGYRVQDVQVDVVMRRVWVRVRRCGRADSPLVMVPLQAPLQTAALPGTEPLSALAPSAHAIAAAASVRVAAVHAGDTVRVVSVSPAVRMEMEGTVRQQAAIGDTVEVTLKRRSNAALDEPEYRMRGVLRADDTVEVQL